MHIFRKTFFITSGLAIIAVLVFLTKAHYVEASLKQGKVFGDWIVHCEKNADNKVANNNPHCYLSQRLVSKDSQAQQFAEFRIGYFGGDILKLVQILPFGISLKAGTSVISDQKLIAPGVFTTCESFGCVSVADLTEASIDSISGAKENFVGMMSVNGKQINLILSNKGIKPGTEYIKSNK